MACLAARDETNGQAPGALILGGGIGSLSVIRSLARHGIPVRVLGAHRLVGFSRYYKSGPDWRGPEADGAATRLIDLARRDGMTGWIVIAGSDPEVRFVAQNHAALSEVFRLTTPPWDVIEPMVDKNLLQRHAATVGVDSPQSYHPRDRIELAKLDCRFPIILKPSTRDVENAFTLAKAWRADNRDMLIGLYDRAVALMGRNAVVLQEMIPGGGITQFSYAAIWNRGAPVASLVARRTRQYPIDFGYTSTFVETVACPEVENAACRFLASLNFSGIAEVEFKFDSRDSRYKILDINPRPWAWIGLGDGVGIDFPHLLWRQAQGETLTPLRPSNDAAWIHVSRDVVAACEEMLLCRLAPEDYTASLRKRLVSAVFTRDDPVPGLVEFPLAMWRALTHRLPIMARQAVAAVVPR
jgi:D-aspartate ligase